MTIQLLANFMIAPAKCGVCGYAGETGEVGSKIRRIIDTGFDAEFYGRFYICELCCKAMASMLDMVEAAEPVPEPFSSREATILAARIEDGITDFTDRITEFSSLLKYFSDDSGNANSEAGIKEPSIVDSESARTEPADDSVIRDEGPVSVPSSKRNAGKPSFDFLD